MLFLSKQIKGEGRGHSVGFPTINLVIPENLVLDDGIYAAWIVIEDRTYKGALHFGPIPTFNILGRSLEVHLVDVTDDNVPRTDTSIIEIDIVEKLRDIKNFDDAEELAIQIAKDVERVNMILK